MIMIRDDPSHLLVGVPERDEHERSAAARSSTTVFKFASSECGAVRVLPSGRRRVRVRVPVCERTADASPGSILRGSGSGHADRDGLEAGVTAVTRTDSKTVQAARLG